VPARQIDATFDSERGGLRAELLAAVEVCGLTGLAVTRPILDSFGRAPETFLARGAGRWDVVLFALAVAVVPPAVVALAGAATGLAGRRVRRWAHLVIVGLLGGLVLWRFGTDATTWASGPLLAAAVAGGLVLLVLRWRVRPVATYLGFVGAASLVFVVQFLVLSPTSSLATGSARPPADEASTEVDGLAPPEAAAARDPGAKQLLDSDLHELEPQDGGGYVPIDGRAGLERVVGADLVPGEGEHAVWQRTAHGALVGRNVADVAVEEDGVGTLTIDQLDRIERPGDAPPVLEVLGRCRLQAGQVVALTVNDVVAAVAPALPVSASAPGEDRVVHALLLPDPFADANDVDAYLVDGEPGSETLHLLTVVG
jgi:hypothetical protein